MKYFIIILINFGLLACSSGGTSYQTTKSKDAAVLPQSFIVQPFQNTPAGDWGYDIVQNKKVFIHQPTIPSQRGKKGFSTEQQARKVGDWVVEKLHRNIMPPTITSQELDSLYRY